MLPLPISLSDTTSSYSTHRRPHVASANHHTPVPAGNGESVGGGSSGVSGGGEGGGRGGLSSVFKGFQGWTR